jgi:hypothetical protein
MPGRIKRKLTVKRVDKKKVALSKKAKDDAREAATRKAGRARHVARSASATKRANARRKKDKHN